MAVRGPLLVSTVFVLFAWGCSSPPHTKELVFWPEVRTGDCWTYRRINYLTQAARDTYELCATFADARAIHSIAQFHGLSDAVDWTWTADWNPVTFPNGVQQTQAGLLQFPLRVGHQYRAAWTEETTGFGLRAQHHRTVWIIGWEEVVVPAGAFRALRLEAEGDYSRTWGAIEAQQSGPARSTIWYAPAVKRWVKRVDEIGPDSRGRYMLRMEPSMTGEELVAFRVQ